MKDHLLSTTVGRCLALLAALSSGQTQALECGTFKFPFCSNAKSDGAQFAGNFDPRTPIGGFGGGADCKGRITHTPAVLVHGNGDSAIGWDSPAPARAGQPARPSVYRELKARGYNDCEIFGVTYLDASEQELAQTANNVHRPAKYEIIWRFIQAVKAYTGSPQVDIVGHSLGVSMTLAALDYYTDDRAEKAWESVRRFINIAGGIRGLNSCVWYGAGAPTCRAESRGAGDAYYEFGFFPDLPWWGGRNRWTAVQGEHSLRQAPLRHPGVAFYTIGAGGQDDIHCPQSLALFTTVLKCANGPLFVAADNVRAQLDIGADPSPTAPGRATTADSDIKSLFPRDLGGIGHFGARNYAGPIIAQMLTSDCRRTACQGKYVGKVATSKP